MMVRWMCGVSLKDRKRSVADVVRRGRLKWFGHLESESVDDWVSACRNMEVARVRCRGGIGRLGKNV